MSLAAATPARADEPGSGRVSGARTLESPRWPLASLASAARADEPGSGRVSSARSRASSDALCARTIELPRWPLASLASAATVATGPRLATESLRGALLWLMAFSGAFVFIEPSPYEVVGLFTIFMFAVTGLSLPRALAPLLLLLVLLNIGYAMAVLQVIDQPKPVIWVGVSAYLTVTAVFYAAALATNTERRLDLIMRGYVAAAVIASLVGIGAYFHAFGASPTCSCAMSASGAPSTTRTSSALS